jgi:hypothetical protein
MVYDFCTSCGLVQARFPLPPSYFYEKYVRLSPNRTQEYVKKLAGWISELMDDKSGLVVEIGSNDGKFLQLMRKAGVSNVLGVDPAKNCVEAAMKNNIETLQSAFNEEISQKIVQERGVPSVIIIRHLLEHIDNLSSILKNILYMMNNSTLLVVEVPDLMWAINRGDFTSFTDQHICYFTRYSLHTLLDRNGISIEYSLIVPNVWSGSLLCIGRKKSSHRILDRGKILQYQTRNIFKKSMRELHKKIKKLKVKGSIVGFGAYCRTANLLNYLDDQNIFEYVVDDDKTKLGKILPGTEKVIKAPKQMINDKIAYCVICALSYEKQIIRRHKEYALRGGRFVGLFPFRENIN